MKEKTQFDPGNLISLLEGETRSSGGIFTAQSLKTGKDFTFKVRRQNYKDRWYTHAWVETQYMKFQYVGFYSNGVIIKNKAVSITPAALAIGWILRCVEVRRPQPQVVFYHLGKCLKCGRDLTDAESIQIGLGPVCRGRK